MKKIITTTTTAQTTPPVKIATSCYDLTSESTKINDDDKEFDIPYEDHKDEMDKRILKEQAEDELVGEDYVAIEEDVTNINTTINNSTDNNNLVFTEGWSINTPYACRHNLPEQSVEKRRIKIPSPSKTRRSNDAVPHRRLGPQLSPNKTNPRTMET